MKNKIIYIILILIISIFTISVISLNKDSNNNIITTSSEVLSNKKYVGELKEMTNMNSQI